MGETAVIGADVRLRGPARWEEGADLEAFLIAHHPGLVALIDRGAVQRGGRSLDAVEREVSRRERKGKRRAA